MDLERPQETKRRNRIIAIAAGAITVIAIVVAFAAEYLELPWKWIRPAAELLLLAELVGLVVLERHQLFEPVHEGVRVIQSGIDDIRATLGSFGEHFATAGQTTLYARPPELVRAMARTAREALARDQQAPQIIYMSRLSGSHPNVENDPELAAELQGFLEAMLAFKLLPGSPPDSRTRSWSIRAIPAFSDLASLEAAMPLLRAMAERDPLNLEVKGLARPRAESLLMPELVTDRDSILTFNDAIASFRWGVLFRGEQYRALVARWLDHLWASIPNSHLIYSRSGFNQKALDLIRKELEALESAQARQTA